MSGMGQLGGMLICAGAIAFGISKMTEEQARTETARADSVRIAEAPPEPEPAQALANAAVIRRENDGHYWALSDVDGTSVKFLVDTGASTVALTFDEANTDDEISAIVISSVYNFLLFDEFVAVILSLLEVVP